MDRVLVTLRAHGDLTRLELEDGLLRGDLPGRLDVESGLIGVDVDLRAEDQTALGDDGTGPSAVLTISGTADLPTIDEIAELVADVAVVVGAYSVHTTEFGQLDEEWVGRATPGSKLIRFLNGSGSEPAVESALDELGERLSNGVRHRVLEELIPSPPLDAVVTTRFPNADDLEAALENEGDTPSEVESVTSGRLLVFEHRFRADPNHWGADDPASA